MTPPPHILAGLRPELAELARRHDALCTARGIVLAFTSGYRTPERQLELYAQGRRLTDAGTWHVIEPAKVVTNALPTQAPHVRRAAYDVCPVVNERPAWDRLDLFQTIGEEGERLGLIWGGRWPKLKDMPHFELRGWRNLPMPTSPR